MPKPAPLAPLAFALLLLPAAGAPPGPATPRRAEALLRFAPPAGARLERAFATEWTAALEEMRVVLSGQPVPAAFLPRMELDFESRARVEVADEVRALRDGAPASLARTFVAVEAASRSRFEMDGAPPERTDEEGTTALVGRTVLFTWDAEAQRYERAFADSEAGAGGDAALLEGLAEDMDLRAFLPPGPVAVGDAWEPEPSAIGDLTDPGGDLGLDGAGAREPDAEDLPVLGTIRCVLESVALRGGRRLATVAVEADVEVATVYTTTLEEVPVTDGTALETFTMALDVAGRLVWDLEAGHLVELALAGPVEIEIDTVKDVEASPEDPTPYESTLRLAGEWSATVAVAAE